MHLSVSGIIINQSGELLVIKRDDTRTWAVPGGSLDAGEGIEQGVIREVEEETGFKVLPVRLVHVAYIPAIGREGTLQFTFRCLLRGGTPRTSLESLDVGYTPTNPLGVPMLRFHRKRVEQALSHTATRPTLETVTLSPLQQLGWWGLAYAFYPLRNWLDRVRGLREYVPPAKWRVSVYVTVRDTAGKLLWVRDGAQQRLPGGPCAPGEAPWTAAHRLLRAQTGLDLSLEHLSAVETSGADALTLLFSAQSATPALAGTFYAADAPPADALAQHVALVGYWPAWEQPTRFRQADAL